MAGGGPTEDGGAAVNSAGRDIGAGVSAEVEDARRLAGLFASFDGARRILEQRVNLGTADMRLLWLLTDGQPRTLRQIAEQLGLEQSTVNRQVNAAVEAGLLVKNRQESHGAYHFTSSPTGDREFEQTLNTTLDAYRDALDALGAHRDTFLMLMTEYVRAYREAVSNT